MLIKESFKDFLITGSFKNIPFGITRKTFTEILGKTSCTIGSRKSKYPSVYKYGIVEFFFAEESDADELYCIMFQPAVNECERGNLQIDFDGWNASLTIDEARNYLITHNIIFTEQKNKFDNEIIDVKTVGGVELSFVQNCDSQPLVFTFFEAQKKLTNSFNKLQ